MARAHYLSVTCSHTFASCNVVDSGTCIGTEETDDICENGVVSRELAFEKYPTYRKPIEEGMLVTVIKRKGH